MEAYRSSLVIPGYEDEDLRILLEEVEIDYTATKQGFHDGKQFERAIRRITILRETEVEEYLICAHDQHVPIIIQLRTGRVLRGYVEFSRETGQVSVLATEGEVTKIITSLARIHTLVLPA